MVAPITPGLAVPNANRSGSQGLLLYVRELLLIYILWLGVVTLSPFSPVGQDLEAVETQTNLLRTGLLLAGFIITLLMLTQRPVTKPRYVFSFFLTALFALTIISSLWAIDPAVSIRRSVAMVVYSMFIICIMAQISVDRALKIIALFLAVVIGVDTISVFVVPDAVHPMSELDPALRGNWRGMHNHKNIAASVAAFSVFMSLYQWRIGGAVARIAYGSAIVLALIFMLGTQSKTSVSLTVFGILAYLINAGTFGRFRSSDRILLFTFGLAAILIIVILGVPKIGEILDDPRALTGRSEIWSILIDYSLKHPLTGSGFGSFWQIGYASPAMSYSHGWAGMSAPHGHNGYLDAAASIGYPGLMIMIIAFVVLPLARIVVMPMEREIRALSTTLVLFSIVYNVFESSFMNTRDLVWTLYLVGYSVILQLRSTTNGGK